jgi:hypothetical protein
LRQGKGSIRLSNKLVVSHSLEKAVLLDRRDELRSAGGILPHQDNIPIPQCSYQRFIDLLAFGLNARVREHNSDCNI